MAVLRNVCRCVSTTVVGGCVFLLKILHNCMFIDDGDNFLSVAQVGWSAITEDLEVLGALSCMEWVETMKIGKKHTTVFCLEIMLQIIF